MKKTLSILIIIVLSITFIACTPTATKSEPEKIQYPKVVHAMGKKVETENLIAIMDLYYSYNTMTDRQKYEFEKTYKETDEYWLIHEFEKDASKYYEGNLTLDNIDVVWGHTPMYERFRTRKEKESMIHSQKNRILTPEERATYKKVSSKVIELLNASEKYITGTQNAPLFTSLDFTKKEYADVFVFNELYIDTEKYKGQGSPYLEYIEMINADFIQDIMPDMEKVIVCRVCENKDKKGESPLQERVNELIDYLTVEETQGYNFLIRLFVDGEADYKYELYNKEINSQTAKDKFMFYDDIVMYVSRH